jgi:hypothetical protein
MVGKKAQEWWCLDGLIANWDVHEGNGGVD